MGRYDFSCNTSAENINDGNSSSTIRVHCYWKNNGWGYCMQPIYGWVTCNGEERLVYNAGYPDFSGDIYGQYELGYSDYIINKTTSNQSIAYSAHLRSDSGYASGERWSNTGYITVNGLASYTIKYNANNGSGAPSNQTKYYGSSLTLSSTIPTRTGYTFVKWNTKADGTGTNYNPNGNYTGNANLVLYAIWEVAYIKPRITNLSAYRCDANGKPNESGQYVKVTGSWNTDLSNVKINIKYKESAQSTWSSKSVKNIDTTITSGTISEIISEITFNLEKIYFICVEIYDEKGSEYKTISEQITINTQSFTMDIRDRGKGVAFGKVANQNNKFDVNYRSIFRKKVKFNNVDFFKNLILDMIYPIGSIYISTNSVNPGTFLGGYWEQIKDTFLLAAGDTYTAGSTGGEATHKLTKNELPKIEGSFATTVPGSHNNYTTGVFTGDSSTWSNHTLVANEQSGHDMWGYKISFGNNQAHNNMPPYLAVYVWKRILPDLYYEVETEPREGFDDICAFELDDNNEYYESQNSDSGIPSSFSYSKVTIYNNTNVNHNLHIDYIDNGYWYRTWGAISKLDPNLDYFGYDSSYPYTGECLVYDQNIDPSTEIKSLDITIPPGEHYIIIKNIRDKFSDTRIKNDYFKFKITLT